ncbi:MAG: type II toxin-antitoxin system VapC family toxin [Rhodospirillales bacterium]|nr:type II toxin-antitoxin system VapC family toxin [Rhodospirillales bacterium]
MTRVVDASVALKVFVDELASDQATALVNSGEPLIAPDLVVAELCNAAWRLWRQGELTEQQVHIIAENAPHLFAERVSHDQLSQRASQIAMNLTHPAYDCFYLALAEQRDCVLMTADRRFIERVRATPWKDRVTSIYER